MVRQSVTKEFTFDAAHRLMHHVGQCKEIHGHTYKVQVTVGGMPNKVTGMIVDFKELKDAIKPLINQFDHSLILNADDRLTNEANMQRKRYVMTVEPTAENMSALIADFLERVGINPIKVVVYETPTSWATWEHIDEELF